MGDEGDIRCAIVTGASGFVGAAVCRLLLSRNVKTIGVVRDAGKIPDDLVSDPGFESCVLDMSEYGSESTKMEKWVEADVLFHFAWAAPWGEGFSDYSVQYENVRLSCDLMKRAAALGIKRFVFSGTYNQFEALELEVRHGAKPRMTTVYSTAKLAADLTLCTLAASFGIEYCSGLIAMAYGPGDRSSKLTNIVLHQLLAGEAPKLVGEDVPYDCVYIDDIARAFVAIAECGVPGTSYYVGHDSAETMGWWMRSFRDALAPDRSLQFGVFPYGGGVDFSQVDMGLLHRDTGFECVADVEQSVRTTAEWIANNNPLGYDIPAR